MKKTWIALILLTLLLTACAPEKAPQETTQTPTVENVFTQPSTTAPDTPTETTAPVGLGGGLGFGFETQERDDQGSYLTYTGGELVAPLSIDVSGNIGSRGIGVLLFVDGLPQPYKAEGKDYAYMHIFQFDRPESRMIDLTFTPVTGEAGDELECYAVPVLAPNYTYTEGIDLGFVYTSAVPVTGCRIKFQETPPAEVFPKASPRLSQPEIRKEPLSYSEVGTWTEQELLENLETHLFANDILDTVTPYVYEVNEAQPIQLRFEVYGTPYVHYGLVFFVDNQPVVSQDGIPIFVDVENGQKTVVEAQLDMTGFDTESVLYAVLVPQNYFSTPIRTFATVTPSSPIFLLEFAQEAYYNKIH